MRPQAPVGFRPPAPPSNPQIGRAIPTEEGSAPGGVRHSRETLILAPHPFANTAAIGAAHLPIAHLTHYNGTVFYVVTSDNGLTVEQMSSEPWDHGLFSVSLDQYQAGWTAEQAAAHMADRFNSNYGMAHGVPHNGRTIQVSEWPWKAWAEQVMYEGTLRWAFTVERGYPAGTPGTEASRADPIWTMVQTGANTETQCLIGYTARIFTPGERGYDLLPARVGMQRAVMPLGQSLADNTTISPYHYGNVS
jgi:hypothetical protein